MTAEPFHFTADDVLALARGIGPCNPAGGHCDEPGHDVARRILVDPDALRAYLDGAEKWRRFVEGIGGATPRSVERLIEHIERAERYRALLAEWRQTPYFDTRKKWGRWVVDFGSRVDAALAPPEGPSERSET